MTGSRAASPRTSSTSESSARTGSANTVLRLRGPGHYLHAVQQRARDVSDVLRRRDRRREGPSPRSLSDSSSSVVQPRVIIVADTTAVILLPDATATNVFVKIDLTASTIVPTAGTSIITDADAVTPYFDLAENFADTALGTPAFVVAYQQFSGGVHKPVLRVFDLSFALLHGPVSWIEPLTTVSWNCSCISVTGALTTGVQNIYAAAWNVTNGFLESLMIHFNLNPAGHVRQRIANAALLAPASQIVIGRTNAEQAFVAYSDYSSFNGGAGRQYDPRGHLWLNVIDFAGAWNINVPFANYSVGSKFFVDSAGGIYGMARYNNPTGADSHYLLVDYTAIGQTYSPPDFWFFAKPLPILHVATGVVPLKNNGLATGVNGMSGQGGDTFTFTAVINGGASVLSGQQIGIWDFQAIGHQRFLNTVSNGELMVAGATPMVYYDEQRLVENASIAIHASATTLHGEDRQYATNTVGGAMVKGIYLYHFVFEWVDGNGKRHQSPASPAVSIDMSASGTNTNRKPGRFRRSTRRGNADRHRR